jgi:hypothetical protein
METGRRNWRRASSVLWRALSAGQDVLVIVLDPPIFPALGRVLVVSLRPQEERLGRHDLGDSAAARGDFALKGQRGAEAVDYPALLGVDRAEHAAEVLEGPCDRRRRLLPGVEQDARPLPTGSIQAMNSSASATQTVTLSTCRLIRSG